MTHEIPQAAYDYVDSFSETYRNLAARLAHENGLVPKEPEPEPDVPLLAVKATILAYGVRPGDFTYKTSVDRALFAFTAELVKHNHAVVKVATDEERLIEARELCAKVAEGLGCGNQANKYRKGDYDKDYEIIAMLAALARRDGVAC